MIPPTTPIVSFNDGLIRADLIRRLHSIDCERLILKLLISILTHQLMILSLIAAVSENNVLGKDNQLVWRMPGDTAYFRQLTHAAPMLMGRKTAESPDMLLSEKRNLIVSRQARPAQTHPPMEWYPDLETAIRHSSNEREVFVCGGAEIYQQTIARADKLYITRIHHTFEGDAFFPAIDNRLWVLTAQQDKSADRDNPYDYSFLQYQRK